MACISHDQKTSKETKEMRTCLPKADTLSVVTMSKVSSSTLYTSRTFPLLIRCSEGGSSVVRSGSSMVATLVC